MHTVKTIGTDQLSYTVTECEDPQLIFNVVISGTLGSGRSCVVDITTVPGTATGKTLIVILCINCDACITIPHIDQLASIKQVTKSFLKENKCM